MWPPHENKPTVADGTAKREPSRSAAGSQEADRPRLGRSYGMPITDVARQLRISTSGASKVLTRRLCGEPDWETGVEVNDVPKSRMSD
jgi:hypothetical protein